MGILALVKKGQGVAKARFSCRGPQGHVPAVPSPRRGVQGLREQNINGGWLPAVDPVATSFGTIGGAYRRRCPAGSLLTCASIQLVVNIQ